MVIVRYCKTMLQSIRVLSCGWPWRSGRTHHRMPKRHVACVDPGVRPQGHQRLPRRAGPDRSRRHPGGGRLTTLRPGRGPLCPFLYGERPEAAFPRVGADHRRPGHERPVLGGGGDDPAHGGSIWCPSSDGSSSRVLSALAGPQRPVWIDDPDFDIDRHVARLALPEPGDDRALGVLVGRLASIKPTGPGRCGELWVIEGSPTGGSHSS